MDFRSTSMKPKLSQTTDLADIGEEDTEDVAEFVDMEANASNECGILKKEVH